MRWCAGTCNGKALGGKNEEKAGDEDFDVFSRPGLAGLTKNGKGNGAGGVEEEEEDEDEDEDEDGYDDGEEVIVFLLIRPCPYLV